MLDENKDEGQNDTQTAAKPEEKDEHRIPKHRFDQVNNELKAFKELGLSPTEIVEMAAEYRNLVENQLAKKEEGKKESKIDETRRRELREGLLEIAPELAQIPGLLDEVKKTKITADTAELQQLEAINEKASNLCQDMFEAAGFDLEKNAKLYDRLERMIANEIYTDKDLTHRFYRGDMKVVRELFKQYEEDVLAHVVKPAKPSTKDLPYLSGKRGLSLPASALDDKVRSGKPLTREEQNQMHKEVFALMQQQQGED